METLQRYFPDWPDATWAQLAALETAFRAWNERINLVSRRDMEAWQTHHLLHCLALAKVLSPAHGTRILDVGTGGGLPGLPIAILFPQTKVFLCDSIEKKAHALRDMVSELGLRNVEIIHKRAETLESRWDYILGRAVTELPRFLGWITKNLRPGGPEDCPHGVLYFKGTRYVEELAAIELNPWKVHALDGWFAEPYFAEKFLLHFDAPTLQACPALRPTPPPPKKKASRARSRRR